MDEIKKQLIKHRINPQSRGYVYLCFILKQIAGRKMLPNLKAEIYPMVAVRYDTSICAVEKAVSCAIGTSLKKMDAQQLIEEYGAIYNENTVKISNKCFIAHILNKINCQVLCLA